MSTVLKKTLLAAGLALAAASLCSVPNAFAAPKKATKVKAAKAKAKPAPEENNIPDGPDADITDTLTTDYNCELGAKLTIFTSEKDDSHIALRWKKRIHRLDKVGTTTGALRFENTTFGLIWIGIPSKGMLLDAKLNRQLANECKNAEQERGDAPAPVEKQSEQPSTKVKVKVEPILPPLAPAPQGEMPAAAVAPVTAPVDAAPAATPAVAAPAATAPAATAPATTPAPAAPPVMPAPAAPVLPAPAAPVLPAPAAPVLPAPAEPALPAPATPVVAAPAAVAPAATPAAPAASPAAPAAATPPVEAAPVVPAPAATPAAAPAKPI